MIFIFGGAWQGKLTYALERFKLTENNVYYCDEKCTSIPEGKKIINKIELWLLALLKNNLDTTENINILVKNNADAVIICNDITCGVVPVDPILRKWREETGKAMGVFSRKSNEVIRLFCGFAERIK